MDTKKIGQKIKRLRELSGITQKKMGELLNYSEAHVSNLENGARTISIKDLHRIADIFNVSYNYFFETPSFNSNSHFRAEVKDGDSNVDEEMWDNFKKYARKQK